VCHCNILYDQFTLEKPPGSVPVETVSINSQQIKVGLAAYDALRVRHHLIFLTPFFVDLLPDLG
jgi:hypothetical protein